MSENDTEDKYSLSSEEQRIALQAILDAKNKIPREEGDAIEGLNRLLPLKDNVYVDDLRFYHDERTKNDIDLAGYVGFLNCIDKSIAAGEVDENPNIKNYAENYVRGEIKDCVFPRSRRIVAIDTSKDADIKLIKAIEAESPNSSISDLEQEFIKRSKEEERKKKSKKKRADKELSARFHASYYRMKGGTTAYRVDAPIEDDDGDDGSSIADATATDSSSELQPKESSQTGNELLLGCIDILSKTSKNSRTKKTAAELAAFLSETEETKSLLDARTDLSKALKKGKKASPAANSLSSVCEIKGLYELLR